jgi:hypothetical protein
MTCPRTRAEPAKQANLKRKLKRKGRVQHSTPPGSLRPFGIKTVPPDSLTMIQQTKEKMVIHYGKQF